MASCCLLCWFVGLFVVSPAIHPIASLRYSVPFEQPGIKRTGRPHTAAAYGRSGDSAWHQGDHEWGESFRCGLVTCWYLHSQTGLCPHMQLVLVITSDLQQPGVIALHVRDQYQSKHSKTQVKQVVHPVQHSKTQAPSKSALTMLVFRSKVRDGHRTIRPFDIIRHTLHPDRRPARSL